LNRLSDRQKNASTPFKPALSWGVQGRVSHRSFYHECPSFACYFVQYIPRAEYFCDSIFTTEGTEEDENTEKNEEKILMGI